MPALLAALHAVCGVSQFLQPQDALDDIELALKKMFTIRLAGPDTNGTLAAGHPGSSPSEPVGAFAGFDSGPGTLGKPGGFESSEPVGAFGGFGPHGCCRRYFRTVSRLTCKVSAMRTCVQPCACNESIA